MAKYAIEVNNVGMKFNLSQEKLDSLKEYVIKMVKGELKYNEFWALKNVSFKVERATVWAYLVLTEQARVRF